MPHAHAPPIPMPPHAAGLQPQLPVSSASGLLALSGQAAFSGQSHSMSSLKEEKGRIRSHVFNFYLFYFIITLRLSGTSEIVAVGGTDIHDIFHHFH